MHPSGQAGGPERGGPPRLEVEGGPPRASPGAGGGAAAKARAYRRVSVSAEAVEAGEAMAKTRVIVKSEEVKARIRVSMKACFLFTGIAEEQEQAIVDAMFEKPCAQGEVIIKEGDEGDNFYVIEKGDFEASKKGEVVFTYKGEGAFGELALLYNTPRAATVTAKAEGLLWGVDRQTFRNIIVVSTMRKRLMYEGVLSKVDLFDSLTQEEINNFADCLVPETIEEGHTVIKEGTEVDSSAKFYIVESGKIEVYKTIRGERMLVKTIESGGFFGEMALIRAHARAADCVAAQKSTLLSINRDAFERVMGPVESALDLAIGGYQKVNENLEKN